MGMVACSHFHGQPDEEDNSADDTKEYDEDAFTEPPADHFTTYQPPPTDNQADEQTNSNSNLCRKAVWDKR